MPAKHVPPAIESRPRPTCESCPFFAGLDSSPGLGHCQRYPPTTPDDVAAQRRPEDRDHRFPKMLAHQWCGEHPDMAAWIDEERRRKFREMRGSVVPAMRDPKLTARPHRWDLP